MNPACRISCFAFLIKITKTYVVIYGFICDGQVKAYGKNTKSTKGRPRAHNGSSLGKTLVSFICGSEQGKLRFCVFIGQITFRKHVMYQVDLDLMQPPL